MKINLVNRRRNAELEDFVTSRLERTVDRFADRIANIDVRIADENGSKGGIDKTCSIDMKLVRRSDIHVSAIGSNFYTVTSDAIHRAETALAKTIERGYRSRQVHQQRVTSGALPLDLAAQE